MQKKGNAAAVACLGGLLLFIVVITMGELTGNPAFCWTMVSLLGLAAAMAICWDHPGSFWFTGLLLNLPIWVLMVAQAGMDQFREHWTGMLAPLFLSYLGGAIGAAHAFVVRKKTSPSH